MPKKPSKPERVNVPLAMPAELDARITEAARRVKLSKQDTMRLSLERGLDVLVRQLTDADAAASAA